MPYAPSGSNRNIKKKKKKKKKKNIFLDALQQEW
jgi:hypothetical protein